MPTIGVALAIPEPWARQLQDYRTSIGDETAAMIPTHITLVPPVAVGDDDLVEIEEHLRLVSFGFTSFSIHLRGTGTFRPVSPVVFVSLVEGISQCEQLAEEVRQGPLDARLSFPYHPHVTIAHHLDDETMDRAFDDLASFDCRFEAEDFALYVHAENVGWQPTMAFELLSRPDREG